MARSSPAGAPLLMGVDAGTTNTKAVIVDTAGRVVAAATEPTPIVYPAPEWAEYEGETLWRVAAGAVRAALGQLDDPARVVGVAFAGMAETAVPLDAAGRTTGPAIAWFDKRTRGELAFIEERVGKDRLFEISGLAPEPIFGLCKLLWHRTHRIEAFERTRKWLNVPDYLAWRACGEMATDYSLACRTFALDLNALVWSHEVLEAVDVDPSIMPPLAPSGRALGTIDARGAAATGLGRHCVVAVGGHDHIVGAVAADAMRPGVLLHSTGTTEAVLMASDRAGRNPALGRAGYTQGVSFVDRPVWYAIGGSFTAGAAIEWFKRTIAADADFATLIAEARDAPPGALGAGFLPQLRLGTPPEPDAHARGAFFGLSTDLGRGHLFRAVLEGIAIDARLCGEGLLRLLPAAEPEAVRVIGGLTRNPLYMEIKAAVMGRPITRVDLVDSVAAGAALLAGLGAGVHADLGSGLAAMRPPEVEIRPETASAAFYDRLVREVFTGAAARLRPLHRAAQTALAGEISPSAPAR
ncbi:MAG: hypothetical protein KDE35_06260 [Geminicoccaceae bacterium]|nr:hypothetical protein [Geminicoccaceae bacterium]